MLVIKNKFYSEIWIIRSVLLRKSLEIFVPLPPVLTELRFTKADEAAAALDSYHVSQRRISMAGGLGPRRGGRPHVRI